MYNFKKALHYQTLLSILTGEILTNGAQNIGAALRDSTVALKDSGKWTDIK